MTIMRRIRDISVATLNDRLEKAEDPVRLIDEYLHEQIEQIRQSEKLLQQCLQHASQLKSQYQQAEDMMKKREEQALLALKAGEDDLARLALQEKLLHQEKFEQYKKLYDDTTESTAELSRQLEQMKSDYREVYNKRQYYLARMESARLQQRLNERLGFAGRSTSERIFQRLEDQVSGIELEAKSLSELRRQGEELLLDAGMTLKQVLDGELARLKQKLEREGAGGQ